MANEFCPCPYDADFGGSDACDVSNKAGLECKFKVVCLSEYDTHLKTEVDPLDPTSGQIISYALNAGSTAIGFAYDEDSADFAQNITNVNNRSTTAGLLKGTGEFTLTNYHWLCLNHRKVFHVFMYDNNDRLFMVPLRLETWNLVIDANPQDGTVRVEWEFSNPNKYDKLCFVDVSLDPLGTFVDNEEFFDAL